MHSFVGGVNESYKFCFFEVFTENAVSHYTFTPIRDEKKKNNMKLQT